MLEVVASPKSTEAIVLRASDRDGAAASEVPPRIGSLLGGRATAGSAVVEFTLAGVPLGDRKVFIKSLSRIPSG